MVSPQHIEEWLSVSYVNAVVTRAGHVFETIKRDYGVDGTIRRVARLNGQLLDVGGMCDCQLKSTTNWLESDGAIVYDMDVVAYNRIIDRMTLSTVPIYLIVFCLPKDDDQWMTQTAQELILRKSCYYTRIDGSKTANKSTVRIKIPERNVLNGDAVRWLVGETREEPA